MSMQRIGMLVCGLLLLLIAFAWFDGGEEPLHPISQPVALPESAR